MSTPTRFWRPRIRTMLALILLAVVALSIYSYWSEYAERAARLEREMLTPTRGAMCTVVFRRQAVGIDRMSPAPDEVNGVHNSVQGRFRLMNDDWLVLDGASGEAPQLWIPRENVLVVQVQSE